MVSVRTRPVLDLRRHSLIRGNFLVLASLTVAVWLADVPNNRATLLLLIPLFSGAAGTVETARCMRKRWNFYHGGVLLCLYMDVMALAIMTFLLVYPYWH